MLMESSVPLFPPCFPAAASTATCAGTSRLSICSTTGSRQAFSLGVVMHMWGVYVHSLRQPYHRNRVRQKAPP